MPRKTNAQLTAEIEELKAANQMLLNSAIEIDIEEPEEQDVENHKTGLAAQKDADAFLAQQLQRLDDISIFRGTVHSARAETTTRDGKTRTNTKLCIVSGKGRYKTWTNFQLYDNGVLGKSLKNYQAKSHSGKEDAPEGAGFRQELIIAGEPGGWVSDEQKKEKWPRPSLNCTPATIEVFQWYR